MLGPARTAYGHSGIVVATDGSLKKNGAMGAAFVAKDDRLVERSVAVLGPPSSIRPELTGIALALEACPKEEELTILTDCLSAMRLLQSTQRRDFPLWLHRHSVRHLLKHVVNLLNARSASGSVTRFIKVRAHRGEPLNEAADALAAAAAESDPSRSLALELDADAIYYSFRGMWVEYDSRIREVLTQRAAKLCVSRIMRAKSGRASQEGSPPALPLTATWMLRQGHGRELLGKVLGEMRISTSKKQVLQSIAGSFPCNAVLHKWKIVQSAACALCGHPAETQSHIQCSCPALKEARIRAHHNLAQMLWKGISDATKQWVIAVEQTVSGLLGLEQPEEHIDAWQRAWDEISDPDLEGEGDDELADVEAGLQRKRPDAWAVSWDKRCVLILEFTRPNDWGADSLHSTDAQKITRYTPLRERLARLLPGWEVEIQTYTMGIRGSLDSDRWKTNLNRLGVTGNRADRLLHDLVSQTLVELTDLYKVRYAALQQRPVSIGERGP
jgi:ribonuclease HI